MDSELTAVVIEDDSEVGILLKIILEQAGLTTTVAANGEDGLAAVREHHPVVTTLDVNLPDLDGYTVARRLREFSSTHLIMISGMVDSTDAARGLAAGADDYLVKPFRPRDLRARAQAVVDGLGLDPAPPGPPAAPGA